jgi:choline dehydrogenase
MTKSPADDGSPAENVVDIVVGAGSAGCALAARLADQTKGSVVLLEAGSARTPLWSRIPIGYVFYLGRAREDWKLTGEPEPHCGGRRFALPRGRGVGGTSLINSMMYVRGAPFDYERWAALNLPEWSYEKVLAAYRRGERYAGGPDEYHGGEGPLHVRPPQSRSAFHEAMIAAGKELGFPTTKDFNGAAFEGFGRYQHNQCLDSGLRCSSAAAYLARVPSNLRCITDAHVDRVLIKDGRASGVSYVQNGERRIVHAHRSITLCAGAFMSPAILMRSGIGDPAHLADHGIPVIVDRPDVGRNLHDHFGADIQCLSRIPDTVYSAMTVFGGLHAVWRMLRHGDGPFTFFPYDSGAMIRSAPDEARPDLQFLFGDFTHQGEKRTMSRHGFNLSWNQARPFSRGHVRLRSGDPFDQPAIFHNFLADPRDRAIQVRAFRLAMRLLETNALKPWRGAFLSPAAACETDDEILAYVQETGGQHHHPVGTARMGADDNAVVDGLLRVRSVDGLRVADASIMPDITSGNTNAPCMMIGERAAEFIISENAL